MNDIRIVRQFDYLVGQRRGVAYGAGHHAGDGVLVLTDDAAYLKGDAGVFGVVEVFHARAGAGEVGVLACGLVPDVVFGPGYELEGEAAEFLIAPALDLGVEGLAGHAGLEAIGHLLLSAQAEGVEHEVADLVVLVHDEDYLIVALGPGAVDDIVLALERLVNEAVPVPGQHFLPYLEAGVKVAHGAEVAGVVASVDAAHHLVEKGDDVGLHYVPVRVLRVDVEAEVVAVLNGADVVLEAAGAGLDELLEGLEVVCVNVHGVEAVHEVVHDDVGVDGVQLVLVAGGGLVMRAAEGLDHGAEVGGLCLYRERVGRECVLLHAVDVGLYTVRE